MNQPATATTRDFVALRTFRYDGRTFNRGDVFDAVCPGDKLAALQGARRLQLQSVEQPIKRAKGKFVKKG